MKAHEIDGVRYYRCGDVARLLQNLQNKIEHHLSAARRAKDEATYSDRSAYSLFSKLHEERDRAERQAKGDPYV